MIDIQTLREKNLTILAIGSHPPIIQSMLDFDFLSQKTQVSVKAIIASGRKFERYFFGGKEILIPVFPSIDKLPQSIREEIHFVFNTTSARRAKQSTLDALQQLPNLIGITLFAEDVTEKHALELDAYTKKYEKFIIGPASVGIVIPGSMKVGAIVGTDYRQLLASDVMTPGSVAVLSASGGMVNEIIRVVAQRGKRLSFSLSFGGDRFPLTSPKDAFLAAENDQNTKTIVYYGELGGTDEYDLVELIETKQITKPIICYIAGTVAELFENPPQFGHAKAMAKSKGESAREKRDALKKAGAQVAETFSDFVAYINEIDEKPLEEKKNYSTMLTQMTDRTHALIATSISSDEDGVVKILGEDIQSLAKNNSFGYIVASMFLGRKIVSKELETFVDFVLKLAVDHGPSVSGALNTIVTARAGRDLVSSLATGLLTIGPRFGGATNEAARTWLTGVTDKKSPFELVEMFASQKLYIQGIGHKKYRIDLPDPRVVALLEFTNNLEHKRFTSFALEVQKITTAKKGNLILNVDGTIGAVLLDILSEKEGVSDDELKRLVDTEFFNALFVLSRSVGFIAHFLDQKRLDEGLLRLPTNMVAKAEQTS